MWLPFGALLGAPFPVLAADLPDHTPLRIVIIGDEVNPHGLSDAELTQPADLMAALSDPGSGLVLDGPGAVTLVDSACIDAALVDLAVPTEVDVVVYFAHQSAQGCGGGDQQPTLTAAFQTFLESGGGIVVFHHGIYAANGKDAVLQLLGAVASSIEWDTTVGQSVIATGTGHFVTDNGLVYPATTQYEDAGLGVPAAQYPSFDNIPDERYPALELLTEAGEDRTLLFTSNYAGAGTDLHVLGYDLQRPGWGGRVVFFQPGEHQPTALDDLDGRPFQILANAIVHAASALEPGGNDSTTGDSTGTSGGPGTSTSATSATSGVTTSSDSSGSETDAGTGVSTGGGESGAVDDGSGGCSCTSRRAPPSLLLLLPFLLAWRPRPR